MNTITHTLHFKKAFSYGAAVLTVAIGLASNIVAEQETVLELESSQNLNTWKSISVAEAVIEEDGTIRLPTTGPSLFYRLRITNAEVPNRFAPESIINTTLSLTIQTSTAEHVNPGDVDTFTWNPDASFIAGEDTMMGCAYYAYAKTGPVTGQITFTVCEFTNENEAAKSTGVIALVFTSPTSGTFEVNEGDLRETGTFTLN